MSQPKPYPVFDPAEDPFEEKKPMRWRTRFWLLGGLFEFESDSRTLLRLVHLAYGDLPSHRLATHSAPFRIRLRLVNAGAARARAARRGLAMPPTLRTLSGPGELLCAMMDTHNFALLSPRERAGLIVVSADNMPQPYHVRYELIEFSVFTLAARAQALVPLHGGCVGRKGRGVLLIGESGAGKSTLALHSVLRGLELLAEDAVFVQSEPLLLATGVANFLHLRPDAMRFIDDAAIARRIERSPIIRRRSGVQKFEIDLRRWQGALSRAPMAIEGVVFLSPHRSASAGLVSAVGHRQMVQRLRASQSYAATQPGWGRLMRQLARVHAFEVRRANHPSEAAAAIAQLLS